jgi:hypothetical protein
MVRREAALKKAHLPRLQMADVQEFVRKDALMGRFAD